MIFYPIYSLHNLFLKVMYKDLLWGICSLGPIWILVIKRLTGCELGQKAFLGTRLTMSRMLCKPEICRRSAEMCCKLILHEQTIFKYSIAVVSSD